MIHSKLSSRGVLNFAASRVGKIIISRGTNGYRKLAKGRLLSTGVGDDENTNRYKNEIWDSETTFDELDWGAASSWNTGITKDSFDGEAFGQASAEPSNEISSVTDLKEEDSFVKEIEAATKRSKAYVDGWNKRHEEVSRLMGQALDPGSRGAYLKNTEKDEMYRLHKENPDVYTVEKLAKDYRIMRQRVHAILWLKELEEEEEKRCGHPLDDSIDNLLDNFPEFFNYHDREFHVSSLPFKADFKVMPVDWDGNARDPDEVHYEISKKEDDFLYEDFLKKLKFNKMKAAGEIKDHEYSRRRPSEGWNFTVEKLGPEGKRGGGGGWKFVSQPDGSSRPLNDTEKVFLKREKPYRRRKLLP